MADGDLPPGAPLLYQSLHATALEFVHSMDEDKNFQTRFDEQRIKNIRSEYGFQHSFGQNAYVATNSHKSRIMDTDDFISQLNKMVPALESWITEIKEIIIDEVKNAAVVRASYSMHVRGTAEPIENVVVWFLTMESDGSKVQRSVEYVDPVAGQRIGEAIKASMIK